MMAVAATLVVVLLGVTFLRHALALAPPAEHDPISVLIADFDNRTGDPSLKGRSNRPSSARSKARDSSAPSTADGHPDTGYPPPEQMREEAARELAVKQGLNVVLAGVVAHGRRRLRHFDDGHAAGHRQCRRHRQARASNKDQIMSAATRVVASIRSALGDEMSESDQMFAMTNLSATSIDVVREYAATQDAMSRTVSKKRASTRSRPWRSIRILVSATRLLAGRVAQPAQRGRCREVQPAGVEAPE